MKENRTWEDTIVAIATPPGISAIGMIRLSGSAAFSIIGRLFSSKDLSAERSHTAHVGFLKFHDEILDEVVVTLFKAPHSYTGEDVAEISCHGSPFILQQVVQACTEYGARLAKPGEFTQRAFLNRKMDLAQAEAVADLIASGTTASQRAAMNTMRGGFSATLKSLRDQLIRFSALIELELDFSQEDLEFADRAQLYALISELKDETGKLIRSFQWGNVIRNGVSVAIIGKPNAGKSTLLNALLNENRAIVSEIPGTTRDTIEEVLSMDGILFRLIDTAGIREHTTDLIEAAGIERSREKMKKADLVIYIFDADKEDPVEIARARSAFMDSGTRFILVANKIDLMGENAAGKKFSEINDVVYISASASLHLGKLRSKMTEHYLQDNLKAEDPVITNARHLEALQKAGTSLQAIKEGLDKKLSGDLLAVDIRNCMHWLGTIIGEITTEDQLDYIFSKFCIGK